MVRSLSDSTGRAALSTSCRSVSALDRFVALCSTDARLRQCFLDAIRFFGGGQQQIAALCIVSRALNAVVDTYLFLHPVVSPVGNLRAFCDQRRLRQIGSRYPATITLEIRPPAARFGPYLCPLAIEYFVWTAVGLLNSMQHLRELSIWTELAMHPEFDADVRELSQLRMLRFMGDARAHINGRGRRSMQCARAPRPPLAHFLRCSSFASTSKLL
ncbi:hypothetical protein V8E36_000724 [Tilletia maclaganii]